MKLSLVLLLLTGAMPVTREVYLMGTRSVLTAYASTRDAGQSQLETYIRILEETESDLSVWRTDTPLSRLNETPVGRPFQLSPPIFKLLEDGVFWWKETERAFDPGIGRLLDSRGFYGKPPAVTSTKPVFGMQHFVLDPERQRVFRDADIWIDSGAFGKGEALDRVRRQAEIDGADPWLIDLGGQVMVYGHPPEKPFWTIDVAHPQKRDVAALTLELRSGSLSTTSNSEQPGHVLDPRTGLPVEFTGSVVVWHDRGLVADILSTALFVMGPENGIRWANARGIAACFLVPDGNRLEFRSTERFRTLFNVSSN